MGVPLWVRMKNFLGVFSLTPFERDLLDRLVEKLGPEDAGVLKEQLAKFNAVRRLTKHIDVPGAHGFTNFHCLRFGKDVSDEMQCQKFRHKDSEQVLAETEVKYEDVRIDVKFLTVKGVLFRIEYRSPQRTYYPSGDYEVGNWRIWPDAKSERI